MTNRSYPIQKLYRTVMQYIGLQKESIISNKFRHPFIIVLLILVALMVAVSVYQDGLVGGGFLLIFFISIPLVLSILHPPLGIFIIIISSYLIMLLSRLGVNFPLGTFMDALQLIMIVGFFFKQKIEKKWNIFKTPITTVIFIWIGYNILQILNPAAESRLAWLYTIRTVAIIMLMYFLFLFNIGSIQLMRSVIKLWIGLSLFAACYAFKQEHLGFFNFEEQWLKSDPLLKTLLFIDGHWRKFSIFSDPVTFSYNMAISSILCIALITGPLSIVKKLLLSVFSLFFLINMLYSGTRGAYLLVPAALILFCILMYNKRVLLFSIIAGIGLTFLIFIPTNNQNIVRFQSAFRPSEDASYNLRKINQKRIQPFIQSHPFGGGLGATGTWGARFSPGSFLSTFPPDSGYVRIAVELGWVGLLLFCILIFVILRQGVLNFYSIKNPELKSYCLAAILVVFSLHIGNYPQEAVVQYPSNIIFYLAISFISISKLLDDKLGNLHE